jgi:hypothetical protein
MNTCLRANFIGLILASLLVLSACSAAPQAQPTATPAPTATPTPALVTIPNPLNIPATPLANGWMLYEKPDEGYAVALPATWKPIDMDAKTLSASISSIKDAQLAEMMQGQVGSLVAAGIKFYALDFSPEMYKYGYMNNINVIKQALSGEVSIDVILQMTVSQLEGLDAVTKPVDNQKVSLTAGDGFLLKYQMKSSGGANQPPLIAITQYGLMYKQNFYIITLTTLPALVQQYSAVFDEIAQGFKFLE